MALQPYMTGTFPCDIGTSNSFDATDHYVTMHGTMAVAVNSTTSVLYIHVHNSDQNPEAILPDWCRPLLPGHEAVIPLSGQTAGDKISFGVYNGGGEVHVFGVKNV